MSGGAGTGGSSFSHDTMPPSMERRSSYDFTHQDTMTLLDPEVNARAISQNTVTFASPRLPPARQLYHAATIGSLLPPALANDDAKHEDDDDDEDEVSVMHSREHSRHRPHDPLRRAATGPLTQPSSTPEYRSLAAGLHFEDVLREKSLPGSESRSTSGVANVRITVTGELLEGKRTRKCNDVTVPPRRRNNQNEEDTKEGSVKTFTNLDDFLRDEERRRQKYDAAAAAHQVCMEKVAAAAATAASDEDAANISAAPSPTAKSSTVEPLPHGAEPLAQTPLWISVEDGSDEITELIGRYFGLHPLTIEDCQSRGIREKLEVFPEYLFLVFHALEEAAPMSSKGAATMADLTSEIMKTTPLKLVIFPSLVLSFHKGGLGSVNVVRKQLDKLYRNRVLNTAWLIHGLLDVVSDSLMPVVDTASKEADDMEDLIYVVSPGRQQHKDVLKRMGFIARRLTFLRQRLWSKRDILTSLIERDWQFFLTGVKVPYLRDIYDHLVIMLHKLDSAIEVIVTLQSTYLAVVSIDVAAVSNDGNKAMKTLSAAATILLPLSLIASLMGMNVYVPFDASATGHVSFHDLIPFSTICVCMVLFSFYLYAYFKKRGYL